MKMYEHNLKILSEYYSGMDKIIEKSRRNMKVALEIFEENSYDGEKILKVRKGDRVCYLNGKRNATEAAKIWVESLGELRRNTTVLLMGVGNFFYLKELVEQIEKKIIIIVYEPSLQIFIKFLEIVDIEKWMKKHLIIFWVDGLEGMDKENMKEVLEQVLRYEMLDFCKRLILPNYEILYKEEAIEFTKICRDVALKELSGFSTNRIFSGVMVKNLFSNARYLCDGYKTTQLIEVIPRDIPGIVVAAGPSLNKNIQDLKRAKGKAFIVAVDTAIKPLLKEGIVPDMFAVVDALKPIDLIEVKEVQRIPLMSTLNASPEILEYHKGMKFFFNEGYRFAEEIFRKGGHRIGDVASGGSVATSLFSLLFKIGIETIILVGQDLAYTDNRAYANGTFQEVMKKEDTSHFMMVEGNYEKKVPTRVDLKLFLDWYNEYIGGIKEKNKNFRVINATEGGAKIQNTEIMSLKEAVEQECVKDVDIQNCLERLSPMLDEEARKWTINYLKGLPGEFQKVKKIAYRMKKLFEKLDSICGEEKIDKGEYLNIKRKIEKQKMIMEEEKVYQLITMTMSNAQYILSGEQFNQNESLQEEGKEIAQIGMAYMDDVEKCAVIFENYSEEVFNNLA